MVFESYLITGLVLGVILWATAIIAGDVRFHRWDLVTIIGIALFWPLLLAVMIPILAWDYWHYYKDRKISPEDSHTESFQ